MKRLAYGLILFSLLGACSSMTVKTDFSEDADFSAFETFKYEDSDTNLAQSSPLVHQRIVAVIKREAAASGLSEVDSNADLSVTYYSSTDQQVQFRTNYTGVSGWGRRNRWSMGMGGSTTTATTFERGTIVIDIWDTNENMLVWRGLVEDTVHSNPDRNREMIDRGITRAFEDFPPS